MLCEMPDTFSASAPVGALTALHSDMPGFLPPVPNNVAQFRVRSPAHCKITHYANIIQV
jgi:hypothetical protein